MLNKDNQRELAYVVKIDAIEPIEGSDHCEAAVVGGWRIMVRKNTFKTGDFAVYFEIDSKVPAKPEFEFLEKKHYKIKTQKYTFGGKGCFISQGLLMHFDDFKDNTGRIPSWLALFNTYINTGKNWEDVRFLTKALEVTYSVDSDNKRKANSKDKYKLMAQRHPKIFKNKFIRFIYKRKLGKKLLFIFFGRKKDKKNQWPEWVTKTDEERVQNMPYILKDKTSMIVTEKIDGTSTTFTMRKKGKKLEFYVCSRNVVQTTPNRDCWYDSNVYWEMAEKYNIKKALEDIIYKYDLEWATIQGETFGEGIQKRNYSLNEHDFRAFNLVTSDKGRWGTLEMREELMWRKVPVVPILDTKFVLPDTIDELLDYATDASFIDGKEREGIVIRSKDGQLSFKAVSNEFLLKYHS